MRTLKMEGRVDLDEVESGSNRDRKIERALRSVPEDKMDALMDLVAAVGNHYGV